MLSNHFLESSFLDSTNAEALRIALNDERKSVLQFSAKTPFEQVQILPGSCRALFLSLYHLGLLFSGIISQGFWTEFSWVSMPTSFPDQEGLGISAGRMKSRSADSLFEQ